MPDTRPAPRRHFSAERQALLSGALLVLIVVTLVAVARLGFETLSSARAYVGGEGLWSKAQKDATYHLVRYLYREDPAEYAAFQGQLEVIAGDRQARLELLALEPDYARVREGFLRGRNHPDDVDGMGVFLRRFRRVDFIAEAIGIWTTADASIGELSALGDTIRADIEAGRLTPGVRERHLERVHLLVLEFTRLEDTFSRAMGAGARWAARVLLGVFVAVAALLLGVAALTLWTVMRRIRDSERAIREKEARYRALVDGAPFGIARSAIDGRILAANPALVRMLGYGSVEELEGRVPVRELYSSPEDWERQVMGPALRGEAIRDAEFGVRRRDGTEILVRANGRGLRDAAGTLLGFELFLEDVTGQRELRAQLRQAQKMEAVGHLTGGLAHDFNNILTIILSTARLVEQNLPAVPSAVLADLADLRLAAERGAEMIRKLLAFSRAEQLRFEPHALPALLGEVAQMLGRVLPASIRLEVRPEAEVPAVRTDPALFEQMVLNLATNARDAMPGGGVLTLALGAATMDQAFVSQHGWGRPGSYAMLTVRDTGHGMTPEVIEAIFVPFFTTKPPGQGTGLGLPMVYGLMKQHGGFIDVTSAPGEGTTVTLYFPADGSRPAAPSPAPSPAAATGGRVLIVEDEPVLRRAARRILERSGFAVEEAGDGEAALALVRGNGAPIHLVLSDVVMPRMGGPALYEALQREGIEIPFLFMSGYPARDMPDGIPLPPGVPLLAKPWEPDALIEWVRRQMREAVV